MTRDVMDRAYEDYGHMLREGRFEATRDRLLCELRERGLTFYERPVCSVLSPFLVEAAQYERVRQASTLIVGAINRIGTALVRDPALRSLLGLTPKQEQLVAFDLSNPIEGLGRLDGFLDRHGDIRFVEYNPGVPGGMFFADHLCQAFESLPIVADWSRAYPHRSFELGSRVVPALLSAGVRAGCSATPNLAIIPPVNSDSLASVEAMTELNAVRARYLAAGARMKVTPVESLELVDGQLRSGDFAIESAVVMDWPNIVANVEVDHPLWRAVRERRVWISNSLSAFVLRGHKSLFALLGDPALAGVFDMATQAALARHLPWTRRVSATMTTYRERRVDLPSFILSHKEQLVLKPSSAFGGKGVLLGWETPDDAWNNALQCALADDGEPYVVQERVDIPEREFPCLVDGELRFEQRYYDCNPYVWDGQHVEGLLVRLSNRSLLNLTAGAGSMVAPFLLG